jgi:hypothetical protein
LLAAVYAALILNFRRHRIDDYRGRYRLWYYACGAWFATALLIGSGLTRTIHSAAAELAQVTQVSPDARWLNLGVAMCGAAFLVRLVVEMRAARGAALLLVVSGLVAGVSLGLDTTELSDYGPQFRQWLGAMTRLAAAQLLVLSMVVYARHEYLDAQGVRAERVRRPRRRFALRLSLRRKPVGATGAATVSDAPARKLTVTAPPPAPASSRAADPAHSPPPSAVAHSSASQSQSEKARHRDDEPTTIKLSRAERRRQAKERRRAG